MYLLLEFHYCCYRWCVLNAPPMASHSFSMASRRQSESVLTATSVNLATSQAQSQEYLASPFRQCEKVPEHQPPIHWVPQVPPSCTVCVTFIRTLTVITRHLSQVLIIFVTQHSLKLLIQLLSCSRTILQKLVEKVLQRTPPGPNSLNEAPQKYWSSVYYIASLESLVLSIYIIITATGYN